MGPLLPIINVTLHMLRTIRVNLHYQLYQQFTSITFERLVSHFIKWTSYDTCQFKCIQASNCA